MYTQTQPSDITPVQTGFFQTMKSGLSSLSLQVAQRLSTIPENAVDSMKSMVGTDTRRDKQDTLLIAAASGLFFGPVGPAAVVSAAALTRLADSLLVHAEDAVSTGGDFNPLGVVKDAKLPGTALELVEVAAKETVKTVLTLSRPLKSVLGPIQISTLFALSLGDLVCAQQPLNLSAYTMPEGYNVTNNLAVFPGGCVELAGGTQHFGQFPNPMSAALVADNSDDGTQLEVFAFTMGSIAADLFSSGFFAIGLYTIAQYDAGLFPLQSATFSPTHLSHYSEGGLQADTDIKFVEGRYTEFSFSYLGNTSWMNITQGDHSVSYSAELTDHPDIIAFMGKDVEICGVKVNGGDLIDYLISTTSGPQSSSTSSSSSSSSSTAEPITTSTLVTFVNSTLSSFPSTISSTLRSATSQTPTETSQTPTETSQTATETSQAATETSQAATETSQTPTETSQTATETSQAATETSQTPTETSQAAMRTSQDPTRTSHTATSHTEPPATPTEKATSTSSTDDSRPEDGDDSKDYGWGPFNFIPKFWNGSDAGKAVLVIGPFAFIATAVGLTVCSVRKCRQSEKHRSDPVIPMSSLGDGAAYQVRTDRLERTDSSEMLGRQQSESNFVSSPTFLKHVPGHVDTHLPGQDLDAITSVDDVTAVRDNAKDRMIQDLLSELDPEAATKFGLTDRGSTPSHSYVEPPESPTDVSFQHPHRVYSPAGSIKLGNLRRNSLV